MKKTDNLIINDLINEQYIKSRLSPDKKNFFYLHLIDLLQSIKKIKLNPGSKILDFGCGGSPYQTLFPNTEYYRADYLVSEGQKLDYICLENSKIDEKDECFDFILSTQVLEHVKEPDTYLQECYRLLKDGGRIYCSTHGFFEEHGCPYDFQRWTGEGLKRDLEKAGFIVLNLEKHTAGPRAILFFLINYFNLLPKSGSLMGIGFRLMRRFIHRNVVAIHELLDSRYAQYQVIEKNLEEHSLYIGVAVTAEKRKIV